MIRRWSGALVAGLLGVGLALHPEAARAVAGNANLSAWDAYSAATCATSMTGAGPKGGPVPDDGVWRKVQLDRSGRLATSRITARSVVSGRLTNDSRGSSRLGLRISSASSARPTAASSCPATYVLKSGVGGADVRISRPSWFVVRSVLSVRGPHSGWLRLLSATDSRTWSTRPGGAVTRLVSPGQYILDSELRSSVQVPKGSTSARSSSASLSATLSLFPVGTLRSRQGGGLSYVTVGHRDCTYDRARLVLLDRAQSGARRITVDVDGRRRLDLSGAQLGRSGYYLSGIDPRSGGVIRATVATRSGSTVTMQAVSWPCSA